MSHLLVNGQVPCLDLEGRFPQIALMIGDRDPAPLGKRPDPVLGSQGIGVIVDPEPLIEPDPDPDGLPASVGGHAVPVPPNVDVAVPGHPSCLPVGGVEPDGRQRLKRRRFPEKPIGDDLPAPSVRLTRPSKTLWTTCNRFLSLAVISSLSFPSVMRPPFGECHNKFRRTFLFCYHTPVY